MKRNFERFNTGSEWSELAKLGDVAERNLSIEANSCIANCRRALESAVRWMYEHEAKLIPINNPHSRALIMKQIEHSDFKQILPAWIHLGLRYILETGNKSFHNTDEFSTNNACVVLFYLYSFFEWMQQRYDPEHYQSVPYVFPVLEGIGEAEIKKKIDEISLKQKAAQEKTNKLNEEINICKKKHRRRMNWYTAVIVILLGVAIGLFVHIFAAVKNDQQIALTWPFLPVKSTHILSLATELPQALETKVPETEEEHTMETIPEKEAIVYFGQYEQNGDIASLEPVAWRILDFDETGKKMFVMSEYLLARRAFHSDKGEINWKNSELRKWMNGSEFWGQLFNESEKHAVLTTNVENIEPQGAKGLSYKYNFTAEDEEPTEDKLFLLSRNEYATYVCQPAQTTQAVTMEADQESESGLLYGRWWLRSLAVSDHHHIMCVREQDVEVSGESSEGADANTLCVRPAMWIDLTRVHFIPSSTELDRYEMILNESVTLDHQLDE